MDLNHATRFIRACSATSTSRPNGSGEGRTLTSLIKSQVCNRYTTEPFKTCEHRFVPLQNRHAFVPLGSATSSSYQVVALGIELSAMTLSGSPGQPVLD